MNIGTDKVNDSVRTAVPHHLLDVFDIQDTFSAGDFVYLATQALDDIVSRGKMPIVVGGTAFYLQMLMRGSPGTPPNDPTIQAKVNLYDCGYHAMVPKINSWL
jgi:tRNA dimethylallyltransferase